MPGRAEPDAAVPPAPAETAAPGPHPAASTHPATIAITRAILMTIMTVPGRIRLPGACTALTQGLGFVRPWLRAEREG